MLKTTCGVVNIGRQSAMDYDALREKLKKNEIAGAILDVFSHEPLDKSSKLWDTPNLVITPHVSSDDDGNYVELTLGIFFNNLKLFIDKKELLNKVEGCSKTITIDKIDSVLPEADFLYLALPETPETKNLINKKRLDMLKTTCGIVNIGRQSAMDYDALSEKLKKNEIAGAILDVFSHEPLDKSSKLWDTPNLVITPHVSSDDDGNYVELTLSIFFNNLKLFIENKKLSNQVDKKLGY